eukprot:g34636.t1
MEYLDRVDVEKMFPLVGEGAREQSLTVKDDPLELRRGGISSAKRDSRAMYAITRNLVSLTTVQRLRVAMLKRPETQVEDAILHLPLDFLDAALQHPQFLEHLLSHVLQLAAGIALLLPNLLDQAALLIVQ